MYWLQFSDFYDWPHIQYFDSVADLDLKLSNANLQEISQRMKEAYEIRQAETLKKFCEIIPRLG